MRVAAGALARAPAWNSRVKVGRVPESTIPFSHASNRISRDKLLR